MRYKKEYNFKEEFDFGQYVGISFQKIVSKDPNYIVWCLRNVDWFSLSDDAFEKFIMVCSKSSGNQKKHSKTEKELANYYRNKLIELHEQSKHVDQVGRTVDSNRFPAFNPRIDYFNPWRDVLSDEEASIAFWNTN